MVFGKGMVDHMVMKVAGGKVLDKEGVGGKEGTRDTQRMDKVLVEVLFLE